MAIARSEGTRRLLVITYHFPPDGSIGGQRWAGLTKYLARLGWDVHVVTAAEAGTTAVESALTRHVRPRRKTLNDAYKAAVTRAHSAPQAVEDATASAESAPRRPSWPVRALSAARRLGASSLYLPDHARGWVTRAAGAARSLLREKKFDVVITSGPPHSTHFAGLLATSGFDTQFWIDMRDPWSMTHEMHLPLDRVVRTERLFLRQLEKMVLRRADKVVANTREFAAALKQTEPGIDVIHFPNGIDLEQAPPRDVSAVRGGSVVYAGTLYANRNLSAVFAAMRAVLNERPEAAKVLRLDVAGPLESPHRERMHDEITSAGLDALVHVHGVLKRKDALELVGRSHLALVLAQEQPLCVPAKIYESLGAGVPTLVLAEKDSAAANEARRIGALTLESGDVDGLRSVLEDLLDGRIPLSAEPKAPISYEELAVEMDRLLRESIGG